MALLYESSRFTDTMAKLAPSAGSVPSVTTIEELLASTGPGVNGTLTVEELTGPYELLPAIVAMTGHTTALVVVS